ncbi:MFS transporter [Streptomyces inhibens]|uniref:MFS transporter n=1 Tax=Streptomyces inhibens TaxID=2293571 RepID=UPI001EE745B1|nr:MFS transporter [Streptomyces inhibens]UKY51776.1 MFS transporter [Streptomyces inhibens]
MSASATPDGLRDTSGALLMSKNQVVVASLGCFVTLLLSLLDMNIVSSVSWKMVNDLDPVHGIDLLPWMVTSYALADCIVVPLYGKLADIYGAKRVYIAALLIFLIGSCLCGISQSMTELIVFRTIQGVGGGGLMSVTMVVLGTLFRSDAEEEGGSMKTSSGGIMVGLGVALGPLVGALVANSLNWRWVFYINLPLVLAALVIAVFVLKLPVYSERRKVDFLGAALLAGAAAGILLAVEWGGKQYAWGSPTVLLTLGGGLALLVGFGWRLMTAEEPLISLRLLRNSTFRIMMPIGLITGMGLAGEVLYIGGYLQVGRGMGLTNASYMNLPMAGGMMLSVLTARTVIAVMGKFKYLLTSAGVLQAVILLLFSTLDEHTSLWWVGLGMFGLGLGMGQTLGLALQYMQNAVGLEDIGTATTTQRFTQQLGSSTGFAIFGMIMAKVLSSQLTGAAGAANVDGELNTAVLAQLPPEQRQAAIHAFIDAVTTVFFVAGCVAVVPAVLALFIKEKGTKTKAREKAAEARASAFTA